MIYLDNNATTAVDERVFEAMKPYFLADFGNASSIHAPGRAARAALETARADVASLLGVRSGEIVFTSGGTEADNLAVRGLAMRRRGEGRHIVTSAIEHPAVLKPCQDLEEEGFRVSYLPVDREGIVDLSAMREALDDETILVSVMYANNETGAIQPLSEISKMAKKVGAAVHTDAVQAVGKIPVKAEELGVDLLSLTAHKFHGPKGCGALYVRRGVKLAPMIVGGSHEGGFRAGTENVPGAVGLGACCRLAEKELEARRERMSRLRDRLEKTILEEIADTVVNGSVEQRLPQTSNISFRGVDGESLLMSLDLEGVAVSTGAACHSGSHSGSHVLGEMKLAPDDLQGAIRFSLGTESSREEIDRVLELLPEMVERLRQSATVKSDS